MKLYVSLLILVCLSAALFAQEGTRVVNTDGPPFDRYTKIYSTVGNTLYVCWAKATAPVTSVAFTSISAANPAVFASSGHGFDLNTNPTVTISGGTGSWAAINGTRSVTVIDANSFSIAVDTTGFGAVTGTVVVTTGAPRLQNKIWQVRKIVSDVSGNPVADMWAVGGYDNACSNRTTLSYQ
jgi:hypothetical protein